MEKNKEFVKVLYKKSMFVEMIALAVVTLTCTLVSYINIYLHTGYISLVLWFRSIGIENIAQYVNENLFLRICICASWPCLILFCIFTNRAIEKGKIANRKAIEVFESKTNGQDIINDLISEDVLDVGNMIKGKKYLMFFGSEFIHIYTLMDIETVSLKKNLLGGRLFYDMKIVMKKTREEHKEPLGSFGFDNIGYVVDVIRNINDEVITNGNN